MKYILKKFYPFSDMIRDAQRSAAASNTREGEREKEREKEREQLRGCLIISTNPAVSGK